MVELFNLIEKISEYYGYFFVLVLILSVLTYLLESKPLKTVAIIVCITYIIAEFLVIINFKIFDWQRLLLMVIAIVCLFFLMGVEKNKHSR